MEKNVKLWFLMLDFKLRSFIWNTCRACEA